VATTSGWSPVADPTIERVVADASDADALSRLAEGAAVIYSCAVPAYPRWATDWPALAAALLRAAETSGALLMTTGNLYGYGPVDGPMTEDLPLRPNPSVDPDAFDRRVHTSTKEHRTGLTTTS
jgi:hypothetical protein